MNSYYFTFGLDSPFSKQYVKINADNELSARIMMFSAFGANWAFYYLEEQFKELKEKYHYTELIELFQAEDEGF
jgi:hypothetical protein